MKYLIFIAILFFVGCTHKQTSYKDIPIYKVAPIIESNQNSKILNIGSYMIENKEIIKGSCWDYIDEIYNRSGYTREKRTYIFKSKKDKPPYAPLNVIKVGDWLYFINQSYGKVEHSGVFIAWKNEKNAKAILLSYGGENRNKPARYRVYDISQTFAIIRGVD